MTPFIGARLAFARRLRGRSKRDLATALNVDESAIGHWEADRKVPNAEMITRLGHTLGVPTAFFGFAALSEVAVDAVSFRSLRSLTRRDRDRSCAAAEVAVSIGQWISERYNLPAVSVPDLSSAPPALAAEEVRRVLNLGSRSPLPSIITILESMGIRCFALGLEIDTADALSTWVDGVPYVLLNTGKSMERGQNDGAHELGHLVLHRRLSPAGDRAEREAIEFAAELLVPREALMADLPTVFSMSSLLRLKSHWRVSAGFMLKRLSDLDRVSTWTARSLWRQLSAAGYRSSEPDGRPRSHSQVLSQVVQHERQRTKRPFSAIAQSIGLATSDVRARIDGLLPIHLSATTESITSVAESNSGRPDLRLVE